MLNTKSNWFLAAIIYGGLIITTSCGGLKVGLDDSTQATLKCIADNTCDAATSSSSSSDATSSSSDNNSTDGQSAASYEGSNSGDATTGGGITVIEPDGYNNTQDRYFMGTFSEGSNSAIYSYSSKNCASTYNFPTVIRGYSHNADNFIDYETNTGDLAWVAEVYPDDTFDFSVMFLDMFGHPTVQLDCTCEIVAGYGGYYADEIQCSCGSDEGACTLAYKKI